MAESLRILLSAHAVDDLSRARDYYAAIEPSLGEAFAEAFDAAVKRIRAFPHGASPVDGFPGLRRARMRRFPYGVFYRDTGDPLVVVRVLHNARDTERHL